VSSAKARGSPTAQTSIDEGFLRRALLLGERARGRTGDNPHVGCVIVSAGRVIGEGWTSEPGHHHAEINALLAAESAGHSLSGATLYATLEPCCFVGRTPACSSTLIAKQVARVVFGIRDPHPRVNGRGAELLREAGIEVSEGVCEEEVAASLRDWLGGR
jgi:diaminohydroxyphosphoribosylaminopyrimidine deaminase / 5-amino-6-(5-phosphoribosylamino)uracil reductase